MSRAPLPIRFSLDGRSIAGETLYLDAGANRDELLVAESAVIGVRPAELTTRRLEVAGNSHTYERRRLLYDHLQRLQDLARAGGWALAVEGVDAAANALDPLAA